LASIRMMNEHVCLHSIGLIIILKARRRGRHWD
jgi:hypothetical protein